MSNPNFNNKGDFSFGNLTKVYNSGDYLKNKKSKMLYNREIINYNNYNQYNNRQIINNSKANFMQVNDQGDYLYKLQAQHFNNDISCNTLHYYNNSDLITGLYSFTDLSGVNVILDVSNNVIPSSTCPTLGSYAKIYKNNAAQMYYYYSVDPCGYLFGSPSTCNKNALRNYSYRKITKPSVLSKSQGKCPNS
jgi:hypothetical protein